MIFHRHIKYRDTANVNEESYIDNCVKGQNSYYDEEYFKYYIAAARKVINDGIYYSTPEEFEEDLDTIEVIDKLYSKFYYNKIRQNKH